MNTYQLEKKEKEREIKELEKKELHIGKNYKFKRVHGNKDCVKVIDYDNDFVEIKDEQWEKDGDFTHFVPRVKFNADNFRKGV